MRDAEFRGQRAHVGAGLRVLGVGRRWAGTQVTTIRRHRQIAVFAGNILAAEFTLTGHRGYQAKNPVALPNS